MVFSNYFTAFEAVQILIFLTGIFNFNNGQGLKKCFLFIFSTIAFCGKSRHQTVFTREKFHNNSTLRIINGVDDNGLGYKILGHKKYLMNECDLGHRSFCTIVV